MEGGAETGKRGLARGQVHLPRRHAQSASWPDGGEVWTAGQRHDV